MSAKTYIYIGIALGSLLGSWAGVMIDHGNLFGAWSFVLGILGAIAGLWGGFKLGSG